MRVREEEVEGEGEKVGEGAKWATLSLSNNI